MLTISTERGGTPLSQQSVALTTGVLLPHMCTHTVTEYTVLEYTTGVLALSCFDCCYKIYLTYKSNKLLFTKRYYTGST